YGDAYLDEGLEPSWWDIIPEEQLPFTNYPYTDTYLNVAEIGVPEWQRGANLARANELANPINMTLLDSIRINRRPNGRYANIDGQHRQLMCILRGVPFIRVHVYEFPTDQIEGFYFRGWNKNKSLTHSEKNYSLNRNSPETALMRMILLRAGKFY